MQIAVRISMDEIEQELLFGLDLDNKSGEKLEPKLIEEIIRKKLNIEVREIKTSGSFLFDKKAEIGRLSYRLGELNQKINSITTWNEDAECMQHEYDTLLEQYNKLLKE